MSPVLTVFGATGKQGGSVVKSVLAHPTLSKQYNIRGVTRDPAKPAAKALADQGVEVVQVMSCQTSGEIELIKHRRTLVIRHLFARRLKGPMLCLGSLIASTLPKSKLISLSYDVMSCMRRS